MNSNLPIIYTIIGISPYSAPCYCYIFSENVMNTVVYLQTIVFFACVVTNAD